MPKLPNGKDYSWRDNMFVKLFTWLGKSVENLVDKASGSRLSDSEKEANEWSSEQATIQRQHEVRMQEEYLSPEAQMKSQMRGIRAVGANPALMFGGSMPSASSSGGSSAPDSVNPQADIGSLISMFLAIPKLSSELKTMKTERVNTEAETNRKNAETENLQADTDRKKAETEGLRIQNYIQNQTKDLQIVAYGLKNDKTRTEIDSLLKNIELTDTQIRVGEVQIDYYDSIVRMNDSIVALNGSQMALNCQKIAESKQSMELMRSQINLNNVNADNVAKITPCLQDFYAAQNNLMAAQGKESIAHAEKMVEEKAAIVISNAVENKLLNSDYYDNIIKIKQHEEVVGQHQENIAANKEAVSSVEAENAWNMMFSEFFGNMCAGFGSLLMPAAIKSRGQVEPMTTTTVTTKTNRFDPSRDTKTTTVSTRK